MTKQKSKVATGIPGVLEILRTLDPGSRETLLRNLAEKDPQLVETLKSQLFTFESLVKISPRSLQRLLRRVPEATLALALRDTPNSLRAVLYSHLSKRQGEEIQETLLTGPKRPKSEVLRARHSILELAHQLEESGEIHLGID